MNEKELEIERQFKTLFSWAIDGGFSYEYTYEKGGDSSIDSSIESSMDASDSVESSQLPLTIPQPTLASDYSIAWQEIASPLFATKVFLLPWIRTRIICS